MRKTFIAFTVAVIMTASVLTVRSSAVENRAKISTEEAKKYGAEKKAAEEAKKTIIARVNGAEINMFMLVRAMNRTAPKYVKEGEEASPEITLKIRREALDRLIFEELAVQEAIRQGINPAPEAVDKVLAQVRESVGSEEAYRGYLDQAYLTEDTLRKLIERSQRYELITATEIYGKARVDEKILRDEYEKEKEKFILPDNFAAEDVFLLQGKDEEAAQKKADELLKSIRKNNNDVWKLVLDGTFIVRKINIRKEKNPELYKAVAGMKAGDLSGTIKDIDGFHIIKVIKNEASHQLTFDEAKSAIEPKFLVSAQKQRQEEWGRELRRNAKIEILLNDIEKENKENAGDHEVEKK